MKRKKMAVIMAALIAGLITVSSFSTATMIMKGSSLTNTDLVNINEEGEKGKLAITGNIHHYDMGYMTIDGTQWEDNGIINNAVIYDDYKSIYVGNYEDGDTLSLSANWTIIKDKMRPWREPPYGQEPEVHLTCKEMWNFTITLYDEFRNRLEKAVVSINDTILDESGKTGTVNLQYIFSRSDFYGDNPEKLETKIQCTYYRWCWKPFDHWADFSDLDNLEWGDLEVYLTGPNQDPEITYTSTSPEECKFNESVSFTVTSNDDDNDRIRFYFDWDGDGYNEFYDKDSMTEWYYDLPTTVTINHKWKKEGYPDEREHVANPRVIVEDGLGSFSTWVYFGEIIVPKNKQVVKSSLTTLLERFSFLESLFPFLDGSYKL